MKFLMQKELDPYVFDDKANQRMMFGWLNKWNREKVDLTGALAFLLEYTGEGLEALELATKAVIE